MNAQCRDCGVRRSQTGCHGRCRRCARIANGERVGSWRTMRKDQHCKRCHVRWRQAHCEGLCLKCFNGGRDGRSAKPIGVVRFPPIVRLREIEIPIIVEVIRTIRVGDEEFDVMFDGSCR